jgi:selenocysteine lyase/cysteine desulfurase
LAVHRGYAIDDCSRWLLCPMQAAAPRGYQGFGSFFSDNVEELIAQSDEVYVPPPLPFAVDDLFDAAPPLEFGAAARPHFLVDFQRWTFVNHGAFGAAARVPFEVAQRWRVHCEAQPLVHIDRELFAHIVRGTRDVARALNAAPTDVVFTPNATTALNAVIRSAPLAPGDAVYSLSVCYGSVKTMLRVRAAEAGAQFVDAELRFPLTGGDADVLALVERTLPAHAKLAVFDSVTSNTALVLPIAQLARLCVARCPDIRILVDGAHSLGAPQPLDVPALGVHFFVSNCHEHLCSPRGAAVLWAHPACREALRPLVVSHGAGAGFTSAFMWDGCRDYSPVLAVTHTLRWWRAVGERRAGAYMTATLAAGVAALLARWQTHTLVPLALCSNMALVRLPADTPPGGGGAAAAAPAPTAAVDVAQLLQRQPPACDGPCTSADAKEWQDWLHFEAAVEAPIKCIQGCLYVRITAHIYNEARDYEVLADAVARALGWTSS